MAGLYSYESYDILTSFPFQKLSDLKGKKIGALGSEYPLANRDRSVPVQSNSGEAYTSIQTACTRDFFSYFLRRRREDLRGRQYATFLSLGGPAAPAGR